MVSLFFGGGGSLPPSSSEDDSDDGFVFVPSLAAPGEEDREALSSSALQFRALAEFAAEGRRGAADDSVREAFRALGVAARACASSYGKVEDNRRLAIVASLLPPLAAIEEICGDPLRAPALSPLRPRARGFLNFLGEEVGKALGPQGASALALGPELAELSPA
jgi:hypothetical protein